MVNIIHELWVFLKTLSIRIKLLSTEEFYELLKNCDCEQCWWAILFRYYM